jgi:hypothetical protein
LVVKRDKDLIRKLVLAIEDAPSGYAPNDLAIEGYTPEQIDYHAYLIVDAGLAEGERVDHMQSVGPEVMLRNLTWAGHEFADASRDETRWKKAMGIVQEKSGSVSISVLTELLKSLMKGALGLP